MPSGSVIYPYLKTYIIYSHKIDVKNYVAYSLNVYVKIQTIYLQVIMCCITFDLSVILKDGPIKQY